MKLLFTFLLALSGVAQADEIVSLKSLFAGLENQKPICFGQDYSADYLRANPRQTVKKMKVKMVKDSTVPEFPSEYLEVEVQLKSQRNTKKVYRSFLLCDTAANECHVECDGGKVRAWGNSAGGIVIENHGFVLDGGCGEKDSIVLKPTPGADALFELKRLPKEYCKL